MAILIRVTRLDETIFEIEYKESFTRVKSKVSKEGEKWVKLDGFTSDLFQSFFTPPLNVITPKLKNRRNLYSMKKEFIEALEKAHEIYNLRYDKGKYTERNNTFTSVRNA